MALRTIVRCSQNRFQTPLFTFDEKGIYFYCKDCRRDSDEGPKRGAYHLVTWTQLMSIMAQATRSSLAGLFPAVGENNDGTRSPVSGGSFIFDEISISDNRYSGRGGSREKLDGPGFRLPGGTGPDSENDTPA